MLQRLFVNIFGGWFRLSRWFPADAMRRIRDSVAQGELGHAGELCFAVEARYSPFAVLSGLEPRQRAHGVFSLLRLWDTQDNSGVLLYLQLAERRVEIIADRGVAARVDAGEWQSICDSFAAEIVRDAPEAAVLNCLARINALLTRHFPAESNNPREFPDEPVVL